MALTPQNLGAQRPRPLQPWAVGGPSTGRGVLLFRPQWIDFYNDSPGGLHGGCGGPTRCLAGTGLQGGMVTLLQPSRWRRAPLGEGLVSQS